MSEASSSEDLKLAGAAAAPSPTHELQVAPAQPVAAAAAAGQVQANPGKSGEVLPPPKKSLRRFVLPAIVAAVVIGGGWYGYNWYNVGRFLITTDDAYVKADTAVIATKISGYIATVNVVDNQHVKAGDVLVHLDDGDYKLAADAVQKKIDTANATVARVAQQAQAQQAQIAQTKAQVAQANAQLTSAQADATQTALAYDRAAKLIQTSSGTQQNLDVARADRDKALAAVASAQAAVANAAASVDAATAALAVLQAQGVEAQRNVEEQKVSLAQAQRDLSFTDIRAPFDGIVGNKAAELGEYVQPGTRLLALVPLSSVYVEANFKETQLADMKPGQHVTFGVDALPDSNFNGTVVSIAPASGSEFSLLPPDNATGNFTKIVQRVPVRIKVPLALAESGNLRPGLSVTVAVHTRDGIDSSIGAANAAEAPKLTD